MADRLPGQFDLYLKNGYSVSIQGTSGETHTAIVASIHPNKLRLRLSRAKAITRFQKRDGVQIRYWDATGAYRWEGHIESLAVPRKLVVTRYGGVSVERRKSLRVRSSIPFSFTVTQATQTDLSGQHVTRCRTKDISLSGLAFDCNLPLAVGDKLEMNLTLSRSQQVRALGSVVRSEPEKMINRVGVEFLQLEEKEQKFLLQFLTTQMNQQSTEIPLEPSDSIGGSPDPS